MSEFFVVRRDRKHPCIPEIRHAGTVWDGTGWRREESMPLTEAFREAKRLAGWRREIPENEHAD